jgi:hypothetical protein
MVRTLIQLTEDQHQRLKERAKRDRVSVAEEVRRAVEEHLAQDKREAAWDRLLASAGAFHDKDGARDVSENHDEYLVKAYFERRRIR